MSNCPGKTNRCDRMNAAISRGGAFLDRPSKPCRRGLRSSFPQRVHSTLGTLAQSLWVTIERSIMGNFCVGSNSGRAAHSVNSTDCGGVDPLTLGSQNGATQKAHAVLSPRELGALSGLPRRRTVRVDSETMHHLEVGHMANLATAAVLDTGSGCQVVDVAATGGESWARRQLGTEHAPRGTMMDQLRRVKYAQGGNCPEHASLATGLLLRLGREPNTAINAPVIRVWEGRQTLNTTYAMIGDPRAPEWGDKAVVVDPWPVVPAATILSEAKMHDARTDSWIPYRPSSAGQYVDTFAPGSSAWDSMASQAEVIHPMTSEEVERRLPRSAAMRGQESMEFGDELAEHALRVDRDQHFDVRVGTNPGTAYSDGEHARTFDDVSSGTIDRLRQGIAALDRLQT